MFRKAILLPMIAAAVGVPYLVTEDGWRTQLSQRWSNYWATSSTEAASGQVSKTLPIGSTVPVVTAPPAQVQDMISAIRFDRKSAWVTGNWSRVSIFDADDSLRAMRVPLVTGTTPTDLTGSLTYCFDDEEKMQRMTFRGVTNDPRRLVELLTDKFHLDQETNFGRTVYLSQFQAKTLSFLVVTPPSIQHNTSAASQYSIEFELNWPTAGRGLSKASQDRLTLQ